jgi:hypothetical protein
MCRERVKSWFNRCLHRIETYGNLHAKLMKAIFFVLVVCVAIYLVAVKQLAIAFAFLSIAIAIIATFFASRSLKLTNESLKLTRSTVRPFLSIQTGITRAHITPTAVTLAFEVKNTGAIPGEMLAIDIAFFGDDEVVSNDNVGKKYPILSETPAQPVVFPNATFVINHTIDTSTDLGKQMLEGIRNGKVKTRHRIEYKDMNAEYLTVQTEQLSEEKAGLLNRIPVPPQYWT